MRKNRTSSKPASQLCILGSNIASLNVAINSPNKLYFLSVKPVLNFRLKSVKKVIKKHEQKKIGKKDKVGNEYVEEGLLLQETLGAERDVQIPGREAGNRKGGRGAGCTKLKAEALDGEPEGSPARKNSFRGGGYHC